LADDARTLRIASDQQSAELLPLEGQPSQEVAREINDPTGLLEYVAAEPVPAASPRALSPEGSEAATSRLTLARIVVAIGGLFCAFVLLVVLMVGTVMNTFAQGTTLWSFIPAFAIVLGYCVLVILAVRGHRFAAGIVAAAAWLFALGAWQWIVNISGNPYASLWPAVVFAPVATLYALAATYVASGRGHASKGATSDPGPPPPAA
jgi:hypothetical protein